MTEPDEATFLEFVKSTGDITIVPGVMGTPSERLESFPPKGPGRVFFQVFLHNRSIPGDLYIDPFEERAGYRTDGRNSCVIEFDSSSEHPDRKLLRAGRLWAEFTRLRLDDPDFVRKPAEFEAWYESIAKWVRKQYERVAWNLFASPMALKLHESGWRYDFELTPGQRIDEAKQDSNSATRD